MDIVTLGCRAWTLPLAFLLSTADRVAAESVCFNQFSTSSCAVEFFVHPKAPNSVRTDISDDGQLSLEGAKALSEWAATQSLELQGHTHQVLTPFAGIPEYGVIDWGKVRTYSDFLSVSPDLNLRTQTDLQNELKNTIATVPYWDTKRGYAFPFLLGIQRFPGDDQMPIWPPSLLPSQPPKPLPITGGRNYFMLQFSSIMAVAQQATVQLVETQMPSDYWRAKHDTVYISLSSMPTSENLTTGGQLILEHCTGYLLPDRKTVLTAAHCLNNWSRALDEIDTNSQGAESSGEQPIRSLKCSSEELRFVLSPVILSGDNGNDPSNLLVGTCDRVDVFSADLARFTLVAALGEHPDWKSFMPREMTVGAPTDEDFVYENQIFITQFPHNAEMHEDFGELRPLRGCTIAFAQAVRSDPDISIQDASVLFGCIAADTVSGASGAPVFSRSIDENSDGISVRYTLIGIVKGAVGNSLDTESSALMGTSIVRQSCGFKGLCNLMRRLDD